MELGCTVTESGGELLAEVAGRGINALEELLPEFEVLFNIPLAGPEVAEDGSTPLSWSSKVWLVACRSAWPSSPWTAAMDCCALASATLASAIRPSAMADRTASKSLRTAAAAATERA